MCVIQTYKVEWILDGVAPENCRVCTGQRGESDSICGIPTKSLYSVLSTPYGCTGSVRLGS